MGVLKLYDGASWKEIAGGGGGGSVIDGSFSVTKTGTQSCGAGAYTKMTFQTEGWDEDSWFDLTNDKYLPTKSGLFVFFASSKIGNVNSLKSTRTAFYKNGSIYKEGGREQAAAAATEIASHVAATIQLNGTTDYVECYVYNSDSSARTIDANTERTWFQGFRISD